MADKLTHAITVKTTEEVAHQIAGLAALDGMDGASEWVRHVVSVELARRKKQRDALNSIFQAPRTSCEEYEVGQGLPASPFHGGRT